MAELLSEIEYGRILGSFTAVQEDSGDTVAPDAIPLTGTVVFTPTHDHISYINSAGETASLYLDKVVASIVNGRLVGRDGQDGVVLLASNSNNVSASVLWRAVIRIDPIGPSLEAPELHTFLIEVRRNEISSLIDVIKANSRVHNIALFNDAIAEAAEEFWRRVDSGEFRGNQGPPGPSGGPGVGVAGPVGVPGRVGVDGAPGLGGNMIPDGDLEYSGFFVSGDYQQSSDAVSGDKSVTLTNATSRKIAIEPDSSYLGGAYFKSDVTTSVLVSLRVFGLEGDISRVIENSYNVVGGEWRKCSFALDGVVGDQSLEIIVKTDGRTILADHFTLTNSTVIQGLESDLTAAKEQLEQGMAQLDADLAYVDSERIRLNESLNDLAIVLEDGNVDLTEVNAQLDDLRSDLEAEELNRQNADNAAQLIMQQLDSNLALAQTELADNKIILDNLDLDLVDSLEKIEQTQQNINDLETITLPNLRQELEEADALATQELADLDSRLYGASGDITAAKESLTQLGSDLAAEAEARNQLAQEVASDFTERDARLTEAETALSSAFPTGPFDVSAELSRTIRKSVVEYAVSTSDTVPPTTGWSPASPTRTPGEYIWFRTSITYGDDSTGVSSAAILTGNDGASGPEGPAGEDGADGTGVTILGSFGSEAELPATGSAGDAYLVAGYLYVWVDGSWSNVGLIRGPEGVQGPPGSDGSPTYTWVKYADTDSGGGMSDDPTGKEYIGLAYNKTTITESTTPGDYQWALFAGPKGDQGPAGTKGDSGAQGIGISSITPYFRDVVKGTTAPAKPTLATPTGWSTSEPAWVPNRDLYRVEKVIYTNGAFSYTTVTKIAAYAGIDAAMAAANGKNLNTYTDLPSTSKPGPAPAPNSSRTAGDVHRNRDQATGEIWAEYLWSGSAWTPVNYGDQILRSLDVGKVTGGTGAFQTFFAQKLIADDATINKLWTDQLVGKTAVFNQIAVASGNILVDPNGLDPVLRNNVGGAGWSWDDSGKYWKASSNTNGSTQYNAYTNDGSVYDSNLLDAGAMYVIRYEVWVANVTPTTGARASIYYRRKDGTTAFVGDGTETGGDTDVADPIVAGQWNKVERFWRAPDDVSSGGINFQVIYGVTDSSEIRIRNPFVGKQAPAVMIEDGAISAQKVNAESVAGAVGKFVEAEVGNLVATTGTIETAVIDKIWADGISAKSATFNRLTVAPGNIHPDPYFQQDDSWGGLTRVSSEAPNGKYLSLTADGTTVGQYFGSSSYRGVMVEPGAEYRIRAYLRFGGNTVISRVSFYVRGDKTDGTSYAGGVIFNRDTSVGGNSYKWGWSEATFTMPEDLAGPATFGWFIPTSEASGSIYIASAQVTQKSSTVLIEDGAVNASKINAESVAAAVGQFLTVEAGNIIAGSADIDSLVAQKIAAATATFQKVNAGNIVSSTATIDSAVINQIWADGIAAKAITSNKLTIASSNMIPDPLNTDPDIAAWRSSVSAGWSWNTAGYWEKTSAVTGNNAIRLDSSRDTFYMTSDVTPGQRYVMSFDVWMDAGTAACRYAVRVLRADGTQSYIGDEIEVGGDTSTYSNITGGSWQTVTRYWDAKATDVAASFDVQVNSVAGATAIRVRNINVRPRVGAVEIENGAITANKLSADSVDTNNLRANAITTDKIGANQVVTNHMVANSIDGDRIRANSLDAGKIAAKTITADQISALSISAAEIKTRTILAENIVASTITANEIKARTITAVEIKAGAITANELDVNNITANSGIINNLWTNGLSAKAITTSRLSVAYDNLIPNGNGELGDLTYWPYWAFSAGAPGQTGAVNGFRSASSSFLPIAEGENIPLIGGKEYLMDVWIDSSVSGMDTAIQVNHQTSAGASISAEYPIWPKGMSAGLNYYTGTFTPPANAGKGFFRIVPVHSNGAGGTNIFYNLRVRPKTGGVLIENGAITTDLIKANAITATQLATDSVTSTQIKAGSVTTNSMTANAINGNRITAGTITAEKITSGSFSGDTFTGGEFVGAVVIGGSIATTRYASRDGGIQIGETTGIRAWDSSGRQTVAINGTSNFISGTISTGRQGMPAAILTPVVGGSGQVGGGVWFSVDGSLKDDQAAIYSFLDGSIHIRPKDTTPTGTVFIDGNFIVEDKAYFAGTVTATAFETLGGIIQAGTLKISGNASVDKNFYTDTITVYHPGSASGSANARINSDGSLTLASSSSRSYKTSIEDWAPGVEDVLHLRPRSWVPKTEDSDADLNPTGRYVGFVAEEVDESGFSELVTYKRGPNGELLPDGLNYDRFAAAQQVVLVDHNARINELEEQVALLLSRLDS